MKHWDIKVIGKVQGVFFRASTKAVADQLNVKGFVMNKPDGSVYIEAEGDNFGLDALMEFCQEGPENSEVTHVECKESDQLNGFKNFEIIKKIK